jgi:hypothetical protein
MTYIKRVLGMSLVSGLLALMACTKETSEVEAREVPPLAASELTQYQACTQDADCTHAQNGCCDCANGGEDTAVNKQQLSAFRARFDCKDTPCTMKLAVPDCGSGTVHCTSGRCTYERPK